MAPLVRPEMKYCSSGARIGKAVISMGSMTSGQRLDFSRPLTTDHYLLIYQGELALLNLHHHEGRRSQTVVVFGTHVEDAADPREVFGAFQGLPDLCLVVARLLQGLVQHPLGVIGIAAEAGFRRPESGPVFFGVFLT